MLLPGVWDACHNIKRYVFMGNLIPDIKKIRHWCQHVLRQEPIAQTDSIHQASILAIYKFVCAESTTLQHQIQIDVKGVLDFAYAVNSEDGEYIDMVKAFS